MHKDDVYIACLIEMAQLDDFASLSLSTVAGRLGVKKPSLYFYFKTKEELIAQSLKYAQDQINMSNFSLDLSSDTQAIFASLFEHYYRVFSSKETRCYLQCILKISEHSLPGFLTPSDIIYAIETQSDVILSSLIEHKRLSIDPSKSESLAHIIALLAFEMITQSDSDNKAQWQIDYAIALITKLLT